jgi:hypothetical protein
MISVPVATGGVIPDSTTVKAYLRNQVVDQRRAPIGASVAEGSTANGSVTLALEPGTEYMVGAEVSSKWTYVRVTTPAATKGGFASVASANTVTLPEGELIEVTGTTEVKKITAGAIGKIVRLLFAASVKVVDGENLKLAGNFEATADDILHLVSNGTNWYEVSRSAN